MRVDILTLFTDYFKTPFNSSILKRAVNKKLLEIGLTDIRDFAADKHGTVDDKPFGGGSGMIMKVDVLVPALEQVLKFGEGQKAHKILLSPKGAIFNQKKAKSLAKKDWLILICGHYEGVDERVRQRLVTDEISIGDYLCETTYFDRDYQIRLDGFDASLRGGSYECLRYRVNNAEKRGYMLTLGKEMTPADWGE